MRKFLRPIHLILLLQSGVSAIFVFQRIADADEGFYLAAAQRVSDGLIPYLEFFFPQMPLLPFTFSGLADWGITSLFLLRSTNALAGVLTTYTLYRIIRQHLPTDNVATAAAFLYAFSGLSLNWHTTFMPFALVDLFLLSSFGLLGRMLVDREQFLRNAFFAMLALAIAVNFRLMFIILVPVNLYFLLRRASDYGMSPLRTILVSIIGLVLPSLPALWLLFSSADHFWFNNIGFHLQREPIDGFLPLLLHKLTVFGRFVALPQTLLLLGAAVGSAFVLRSRLVEPNILSKPALAYTLIIAAVCFIPTPIHLRYFQQIVPYLILFSIPTLLLFLQYDRLKMIVGSAGLLYVIGIAPFLYLFILSPRERDERFALDQLRQATAAIDMHSDSRDTVLSEWAGYCALTNRPQLRGAEHVGFHFPLKVTAGQYERYHLLTNEAIVAALDARRPALVVIDYQEYPGWRSALAGNYHLVETVGQMLLYKKNDEIL